MKRIWRLLRGRRTQVELTVSVISGGEELWPEEWEEENNVAPAPSLSSVPPESSSKTLEQELEKYEEALAEKMAALNRAETKLPLMQREEEKGLALEAVRDQEGGDASRRAEELQQELANLQSENLSLRHQLDHAWYKSELEHLRAMALLQEAFRHAVRREAMAELSWKMYQHHRKILAENSRLRHDLEKAEAKMKMMALASAGKTAKSRGRSWWKLLKRSRRS